MYACLYRVSVLVCELRSVFKYRTLLRSFAHVCVRDRVTFYGYVCVRVCVCTFTCSCVCVWIYVFYKGNGICIGAWPVWPRQHFFAAKFEWQSQRQTATNEDRSMRPYPQITNDP